VKRALVFALLLSCKNQQDEQKKAELKQALADKEVARVDMERTRAKALAMKQISGDLDALLGKMQAKMTEAELALDAASKNPKDAAAVAAAERITDELEVMQKQADVLKNQLTSEETRIGALPVTCFTKPTPAECKLPAESSTKTDE
jgi:hypothetical protein